MLHCGLRNGESEIRNLKSEIPGILLSRQNHAVGVVTQPPFSIDSALAGAYYFNMFRRSARR